MRRPSTGFPRLNQDLSTDLHVAREQLHRYRQLFRLAPTGYLVTDADGTILEGNRPSAQLLRAGEKDLLGQPVASFLADGGTQPFPGRSSVCCTAASGSRDGK